MRKFWILTLCLIFLAGGCATRRYQIARAVEPVEVDGKLDVGEWDRAQEIAPVQVTSGAGGEPTSIRILYDKDFIYLGVRCADSQITERNDDFWKNDSVAAGFQIGVVATEDLFRFGFRTTPQGLVSARWFSGKWPTPPMDQVMDALRDMTKPLPPDLYRVACAVDDDGWSVEIALSWAAIRPLPAPPAPFRVRIERRNINGDKIDVADWPYREEVEFQFEPQSHDEQTAGGHSS